MLTPSSSARLLLALACLPSLSCGNTPAAPAGAEPLEPPRVIEVAAPAPAPASSGRGSDDVASPAIDEGAQATDLDAPTRCQPPEGTSGAPGNVDELVALLNALPRPTSLACFLESLERPLELFLTRSDQSAQPAAGPENPRTFVVIGNLTLTVVPSGRTRSLVEFGYATTPGRSIKGEFEFPLWSPVTASMSAERIARAAGTTCGTCHLRESDVSEAYYEGAYESDERPPFLFYEVDIEALRQESAACDASLDPQRCDMLRALFDHGEVRRTTRWASEGEYEPPEADAGATLDAGADAG